MDTVQITFISSTVIGIFATILVLVLLPIPTEYLKYAIALPVVVGLIGFIVYTSLYLRTGGPEQANTKNLDVYSGLTKPGPLACPIKDDTLLCDYYLAGSAYSVNPENTAYSYVTEESIRKIIQAGARIVELHVYGENGTPVVGLADTVTKEKYSYNTVPLDDCCKVLANDAFNAGTTSVSSDPFVVSVVFHTEDTTIINAAASVMKTTIVNRMLDSSYSYQRKNIATEPVCNFAGKFIIVSGKNVKGTDMDELTNMIFGESNLRREKYNDTTMTHSFEEKIEYNRRNITMVVPDDSVSLKNGNPQILFTYGCQWVLMNYGSLDEGMMSYKGHFENASALLKPDSLRPKKAPTLNIPAPPNPAEVSFQPKTYISPLGDITL